MGNKNYQKKEVKRTEEGFYICDRCGGYFEEEDMTRGRFGIIGICKKCTSESHKEGAKNRKKKLDAQNKELQDLRIEVAELKRQLVEQNANALKHATGRDLIHELKKRGYEGNITVVTKRTFDLQKFDD